MLEVGKQIQHVHELNPKSERAGDDQNVILFYLA